MVILRFSGIYSRNITQTDRHDQMHLYLILESMIYLSSSTQKCGLLRLVTVFEFSKHTCVKLSIERRQEVSWLK